MTARGLPIAVIAALLTFASASRGFAQISLPSKAHETLSFEIVSLRDNITLYQGDPQQLLHMNVRPDRFRPRVEYTSQAAAILRIRDLYIFDHPDYASMTPAERDEEEHGPFPEEWEIRLYPSGPTSFAMQCERGEAALDFTDFEVQRVDLRADETKVDVEFNGQNSILLESFAAHVPAGSLRFHHVLHARAKEITLSVPNSVCLFEITGEPFDGESAVSFQGVPSKLELLVSRKVGVRVTGPAATTAHFEAPHMARDGEDLVSQGYESAKCRIRLTFFEAIPELVVDWD